MMEQNEFRIGNWVLDNGKPVQIAGLQATGRIVVEDKTYDDFKRGIDPVPILLTPEVLEKCGFKRGMPGYGYYTPLFFIYLPGSLSSDFSFGVRGIGLICSIKHLNQLQNICFALNGVELEYTP